MMLDCAHYDRYLWKSGKDITRISSRWSSIWDRSDVTVADYASLYANRVIMTISQNDWLAVELTMSPLSEDRIGPRFAPPLPYRTPRVRMLIARLTCWRVAP
jgi:hypothetical protein